MIIDDGVFLIIATENPLALNTSSKYCISACFLSIIADLEGPVLHTTIHTCEHPRVVVGMGTGLCGWVCGRPRQKGGLLPISP